MSLDALTPDESKRIKEVIESGEQVLAEIDSLKEDMKEYVSSLSEELNVKPAVVNKAIRIAYKSRQENAFDQAQQEMSDVEILLAAANKI